MKQGKPTTYLFITSQNKLTVELKHKTIASGIKGRLGKMWAFSRRKWETWL